MREMSFTDNWTQARLDNEKKLANEFVNYQQLRMGYMLWVQRY